MKNLKVYLPLVDGGVLPLDYSSGRELIHGMVSDDFGAPPHSLCFEAITEDGRSITISVPYSDSDVVFIRIDDNA
jgi:hypothetical protein